MREQEAESRELCKREGWEVVSVVADSVGASRHSKGKRSGWERVLTEIGAGTVDVLVTWEASRAQRDLDAYTALRNLCVEAGVRWHYGGSTYDMADRTDRFRTGLDALLAEDEAGRISDRVLRAVRGNAATGKPHGRLLFGYQRIYDPITRELIRQEPHPDQAPIVRRVFDAYLAGTPVTRIATDLNRDAIPTSSGKEWTYTQLVRILQNPGYAGRRVHQGEVVGPAAWPPLIDPDDFDRVQVRRKELYAPQPYGSAHLLTGVSRCGVCGGKVTTFKTHGRRVYQCRNHHVARDQAKMDAYIEVAIIERLERADLLEASPSEPGEAADLRREIAEYEQRLEDATAGFASGQLSAAAMIRIDRSIQGELANLRRRLRQSFMPGPMDVPTGDVRHWWDALGAEERRLYVSALVDVVVIHRTTKGQRTFDPSKVEIVWR